MKHFITCLACCFGLISVHAQLITPDLSFGEEGYVKTSIYPYTHYGTVIDRTIGNELLLVGSVLGSEGWKPSLVRYSTLGDSIISMPLPITPVFSVSATAIKSLPDGGVLVANSSQPYELFKIKPDGTLDSAFGMNGSTSLLRNNVQEIIIDQSADRILTAGYVINNSSESLRGAYVNAFHLDGRPDSTFGENGRFYFRQGTFDFFFRILQQHDGKLLVAGLSSFDTVRYNSLIRLTQDGVLDTAFGTNGVVAERFTGNGETYSLVVQPDQKILICGYNYPPYQAVVARYLPDGTRDESFGDNGFVVLPEVNEATDMMVLPNGKILIYGWLQYTGRRTAFFQLLTDGTLDPEFGVNGVYFSAFSNFQPPMKMLLVDNNRIIGTGGWEMLINPYLYRFIQLQGFLLSLNVGVVTPQAEPAMWVYPNPIGASCQVGFTLESAETVALDLFDMQGKLLSTLLPDTRFESGEHQVPVWLGESMAPGTYVVRITVRGQPSVAVQVVKR